MRHGHRRRARFGLAVGFYIVTARDGGGIERRVRGVPVWVVPVLVVVLALYIQQVLQIDFSWRPSEESAKAMSAR